MKKTQETPKTGGPVVLGRLRTQDEAFFAGMVEGRQEGLDALEALAEAVGTCTESTPRVGTMETKRLDVLLSLTIEAFRARQTESQALQQKSA
jgi:hypothetical protein